MTTPHPLNPERLAEIRAARYSNRSTAAADVDIDDLLAEVDRLTAERNSLLGTSVQLLETNARLLNENGRLLGIPQGGAR
jgi:hypothetical protein